MCFPTFNCWRSDLDFAICYQDLISRPINADAIFKEASRFINFKELVLSTKIFQSIPDNIGSVNIKQSFNSHIDIFKSIQCSYSNIVLKRTAKSISKHNKCACSWMLVLILIATFELLLWLEWLLLFSI